MKHVGSAARPRFCVLVTGFGAFPGARSNPTIAILEQLSLSRARLARLGIELRFVVIPVVYAEIEGMLNRLTAEDPPDAILHLGLAGRRKVLSVETRALNRAGPLHPDASGQRPPSQVLTRAARHSLTASYAAEEVVSAIRRSGLPARRSIDAGDYVCNATLYRSLAASAATQVGFLHVPRPRRSSQPVARSRSARPTIAALTRGALAAILVMARQRRVPTASAPKAPPTDVAPEDRSGR